MWRFLFDPAPIPAHWSIQAHSESSETCHGLLGNSPYEKLRRQERKELTSNPWQDPDGETNENLRNKALVWDVDDLSQREQRNKRYRQDIQIGCLKSSMISPADLYFRCYLQRTCTVIWPMNPLIVHAGDGVANLPVAATWKPEMALLVALRKSIACQYVRNFASGGAERTGDGEVYDESVSEMLLLRKDSIANENEASTKGRERATDEGRHDDSIVNAGHFDGEI